MVPNIDRFGAVVCVAVVCVAVVCVAVVCVTAASFCPVLMPDNPSNSECEMNIRSNSQKIFLLYACYRLYPAKCMCLCCY